MVRDKKGEIRRLAKIVKFGVIEYPDGAKIEILCESRL